ncbi:GHKL domain-containing protein [Clostridium sp.]|uniref:GHKL domain-containing protein n=1 Tax=Clostridium sp. TaxID=1506 RepID=UPI003D6D78A1
MLFDNAIESALMCKVKKINFGLVKNEGITVLSISNSCMTDTPSIHQMYEKNFLQKVRIEVLD